MARFLVDAPRVELSRWSRASAEVRQAVIDREVHFGLVVNTDPHDDLVILSAFEDRIQVFGPDGLGANFVGVAAVTGEER